MNGDGVAKAKKSQGHFEEKTDETVKSCVGGARIAFGTSGWRGRLGQDFVLANVQRATQGVAEYYGRHLGRGFILIGFDPRGGNYEFAIEIASILAANNIPVKIILEEPTPTPVLAYLASARATSATTLAAAMLLSIAYLPRLLLAPSLKINIGVPANAACDIPLLPIAATMFPSNNYLKTINDKRVPQYKIF